MPKYLFKCHHVELFWAQIDSFLRETGLNIVQVIGIDMLFGMENTGVEKDIVSIICFS